MSDRISHGRPDIQKEQIKASIVSIAGSFFIMVLFALGGMIVGSTTMLISSATSMIMVATGLLTFFAAGKINRPADETFNFGYDKYEPFTMTGQGLLIIATCIVGIKFAVQDIIHPEDIKNYHIPVAVCIVSGLSGLVILGYIRKRAQNTGTELLRMAALHWKTDILLSFGLFAGFLAGLLLTGRGRTEYTHYLDPAMTIILALYLIKPPLEAVIHNSHELLDGAPVGETKKKIKEVVEAHLPRYLGVDRVRARKAGGRIFVDVCFEVHSDLTAKKMAKLTEHFEKDVKTHFPDCDVVVFFTSKSEGV